MGQCAGVAYDSDINDVSKCRKRGLQCVKDGHGRVLEFVDVYLAISGVSVRVIREMFRHVSDGLTAVQRSTRYCNESGFDYYVPPKISKDETASQVYNQAMNNIMEAYGHLLALKVPKEDCANILPLGMETKFSIKKNARALSDMCKVRLCNRAYIEYRQLMREIIRQLSEYSQEWAELCPLIFKAKCEYTGWCDEHQSCGRYPKKEDTVVIEKRKFNSGVNQIYKKPFSAFNSTEKKPVWTQAIPDSGQWHVSA